MQLGKNPGTNLVVPEHLGTYMEEGGWLPNPPSTLDNVLERIPSPHGGKKANCPYVGTWVKMKENRLHDPPKVLWMGRKETSKVSIDEKACGGLWGPVGNKAPRVKIQMGFVEWKLDGLYPIGICYQLYAAEGGWTQTSKPPGIPVWEGPHGGAHQPPTNPKVSRAQRRLSGSRSCWLLSVTGSAK